MTTHMSGDIITFPKHRTQPVCAMTADTAYRVMQLYEAAIELGFRAEVHTSTGDYKRAHLCRRAVSRLRRMAFGCLLTNLPKEELPHFTDRVFTRQATASPLWQLCI